MPRSFHKRNSFNLSNYYNKALNEDFNTWDIFSIGHNAENQLGRYRTGADASSPVLMWGGTNKSNWSMLSGEHSGVFGIKPDGTLWAWGGNGSNQLGQDGQIERRTSPIQVFPEYNWIDVAQGNDFNATSICAVAVRNDGTLWTWGTNSWGSLGVNSNFSEEKYSSPVQVGSDTDWSFTYQHDGYGDDHSGSFQYAGKVDGTLWGWGRNGHGQLGQNNTQPTSSPVQLLGGNGWTNKIARYYEGFAAIKNDGSLWTCGYNSHGELGDINFGISPRSSPIQVPGTWSKLTTGRHHVNAIKSDGSLWGWGHNNYGQLGVNNTINYSSPIQIPGTWVDVAGAGYSTYAIKTGGTLWAWGHGSRGANHSNLGNNTTTNVSSPVQLGALSAWTDVWACDTFGWARKSDGTIWGWGRNNGRVLGVTNTSPSPGVINPPNKAYEEYMNLSSPIQVMASGANTWNKIMLAPDRVYLINSSNKLFGMGMDEQYRVVDFGSRPASPIQIPGSWKYVRSTQSITFGIKTDGTLWHWGYGGWGQGGNLYNIDHASPIQVGSDSDWESVASSYHGVYGKKTNGNLYSWGHNNHGQLGLNNTTSYSSPVQIPGTWKTISTTYGNEGWQNREGTVYHVLATKSDDTLWGWGHNSHGEVRGDWSRKTSSPIQYASPSGKVWTSLATNYVRNAYGVNTSGELWSFGGRNDYGQLGQSDRTYRSSPIQIPGTTWDQVQAGGHHVHALQTNDSFWSWGHNNHGQLGLNNTINYSSPVQVPGNIRNFHTFRDHSTYVRTDSNMFYMGYNNHGQIGDNSVVPRSSPIQIGSNQWRQSSCGFQHSAAVRNDGTLWAWGVNNYGQLGVNDLTHRSSPIQIGTLSTWSTTHCGYNQTFAIKLDGTLWAWGQNTDGQLGVNTAIPNYSSPVQIPGNTWNSVTVRDQYENDNNDRGHYGVIQVYATRSDNSLWAWGKGYNHQLGTVVNTNYSSPVQIPGSWRIVSDNSGNYSNTDFASRQPFAVDSLRGLMAQTGNTGDNLYYVGQHPQDEFKPNAPGEPTTGNDVSSPIQIMPGTWLQAHANRFRVSCALRSDGTIWAWGVNSHGQNGTGDRFSRSSPAQLMGSNYTYVGSGVYGSVSAVKSDGTLWGFGYDGHGQLGWGRNVSTSSPVQAFGTEYTVMPTFKRDYQSRSFGRHCQYVAKERR
jgi:alpha-tubulin suppressor-like RCC1 family protein